LRLIGFNLQAKVCVGSNTAQAPIDKRLNSPGIALFPVFVLVPLARYRRFTSTRTRERRLGDGARDHQNLMNPF